MSNESIPSARQVNNPHYIAGPHLELRRVLGVSGTRGISGCNGGCGRSDRARRLTKTWVLDKPDRYVDRAHRSRWSPPREARAGGRHSPYLSRSLPRQRFQPAFKSFPGALGDRRPRTARAVGKPRGPPRLRRSRFGVGAGEAPNDAAGRPSRASARGLAYATIPLHPRPFSCTTPTCVRAPCVRHRHGRAAMPKPRLAVRTIPTPLVVALKWDSTLHPLAATLGDPPRS